MLLILMINLLFLNISIPNLSLINVCLFSNQTQIVLLGIPITLLFWNVYPYSLILYLIIIHHLYRIYQSIIFKNTFESFPLSPETIRKCLCFLPNKFNNSSDCLTKGVLQILSFELCVEYV